MFIKDFSNKVSLVGVLDIRAREEHSQTFKNSENRAPQTLRKVDVTKSKYSRNKSKQRTQVCSFPTAAINNEQTAQMYIILQFYRLKVQS